MRGWWGLGNRRGKFGGGVDEPAGAWDGRIEEIAAEGAGRGVVGDDAVRRYGGFGGRDHVDAFFLERKGPLSWSPSSCFFRMIDRCSWQDLLGRRNQIHFIDGKLEHYVRKVDHRESSH